MEVIEINATTGEVVKRNLTEAEKDQRVLDAANLKKEKVKEQNRLKEIHSARDFALSLGFTPAMLAVMYPQLAEAPNE